MRVQSLNVGKLQNNAKTRGSGGLSHEGREKAGKANEGTKRTWLDRDKHDTGACPRVEGGRQAQ